MTRYALLSSTLQLVLALCAAAKKDVFPATPLADLRFPMPSDAVRKFL
jgi:hypothetical protein